MVLGALTASRDEAARQLGPALRLPAAALFLLAALGISAVSVCARRIDRYYVHGNWVEQGVNALAQGCFLLGALCL